MKYSLSFLTLVSALALTAGSVQAESVTDLGYFVGASTATAFAISADATTIVGSSSVGGDIEAFRWTQASGMVSIGDLPGNLIVGSARGVSGNGSIVVGSSMSTNGNEAFRWTQVGGMVGLGDLAGGTFSSTANGVSADGSIVVGNGASGSGTEAFRWTQVGGMVGLGDLAGGTFNSTAFGISADGSVIVGRGNSASGNEAFRWTQVGGMVGLGDLVGGTFDSVANGVNEDGSVIVGYGTSALGQEALRWTQADGIESINTILADAGVDMTGWLLTGANAVDPTGNLVVGFANFNGNTVAYLANLTTMAVSNPVDIVDGLVSALVPVGQSRSAMTAHIGQSLFAATNSLSTFRPVTDFSDLSSIAPAAGDSDRVWSGYIVGSFGAGQNNDFDNNVIDGTMGIVVELDRNFVVGAGIIGSHSRADRKYSGDSSLDSKGGSIIAAYETGNGLRLSGTVFVADLQVGSKRGYLNGAGFDASYADIDGIGFGAAIRGGYEFAVTDKTKLMPYVEIQSSRTKLDGYTETGGGFPATFGDTTSDLVTSYLGTEISYDMTPSLSLAGRAAWAHRLKESDSGISASVTGFTGTFDSEEGDQNWAEGAVTANWKITEDSRLDMELAGRSGKTQEPAATLTLGLHHRF